MCVCVRVGWGGPCLELSVRVTREFVTDCISAHQGTQWYPATQRRWKNKLKRPRTTQSFHYPCILYFTRDYSGFLESLSGPSVISQRDTTLSRLHWKVLMPDVKRRRSHLRKEGVWYCRLTAQSREKWKCGAWHVWDRAGACVSGGSGKWLVINTSDTPGLPSTLHSTVFFVD